MADLLFEIGCEELPASACREALEQLPSLCERHIGRSPTRTFVGPRRLTLVVEGLADYKEDVFIYGPPVNIAFDADGKPTKAAEGFARRNNISVEELQVTERGVGFLRRGESLRDALPDVLAAIVEGLSFGKSMAWGPPLRFSRPVRSLLAKLDSETIPVVVEGVPAGEVTQGHRFTAGEIEVPDAGAYLGLLRNAGVEPDQEERRRRIVEGLDALGAWSDPARKLEEVVHLVESPRVQEGSFDERYLQLPERVVVTAMQSHQRYFPLGGTRFAFVANGGDPEVVRAGNEQVLAGRLDDALFTLERDLARGVDGLAAELERITFVARAGTFADKTVRLGRLVEALGGSDAARDAARLAKADQAAELVREFPDLEGHIGSRYASLAGYPEAVCAAIEEQYLPDAAGGPLPQTEAGRALAAAERVDNLVVAFALGQRPTGSRDPYALRRAAIGLCRLAVEGGMRIDLARLVPLDHAALLEQGAEVGEEPRDVRDFVAERLEGLLDVPVEFVRAAAASGIGELRTLAEVAETLAALEPDRLATLVTAYARAHRLASRAAGDAAGALRPDLLVEPAEREVAEALAQVDVQVAGALARHDVVAAIGAAAKLGPPVDRLLDSGTGVLIMADDPGLRANRLRLLLDVRDTIGRIADLSLLPGA